MRLWHDDVRKPPDDTWTWARTNEIAQGLLLDHTCTECSLDHDLGCEGVDPDDPTGPYLRGSSPRGSGLDFVRWMIERDLVPPVVTIHSWNPAGAKAMALSLADAGHACTVAPYRAP